MKANNMRKNGCFWGWGCACYWYQHIILMPWPKTALFLQKDTIYIGWNGSTEWFPYKAAINIIYKW